MVFPRDLARSIRRNRYQFVTKAVHFRCGQASGTDHGKVMFSVNTGPRAIVVLPDTRIEDNVWYHIAGIYEGSTAQILVNGVLASRVSDSSRTETTTLGTPQLGVTSLCFNANFSGLVDEVEVFDRALTAEEIRAIYDAGAEGKRDMSRVFRKHQ